jgi:putative component of membrane protein insertase Oxa1/YidC/SpoIIIJ protein YidD
MTATPRGLLVATFVACFMELVEATTRSPLIELWRCGACAGWHRHGTDVLPARSRERRRTGD